MYTIVSRITIKNTCDKFEFLMIVNMSDLKKPSCSLPYSPILISWFNFEFAAWRSTWLQSFLNPEPVTMTEGSDSEACSPKQDVSIQIFVSLQNVM